MSRWCDVRQKITSLNETEKQHIDFTVDLVSNVINRRKELNLTQRELAKRSGIKQSAIARLEKLEAIPRIDTLGKLLNPLGLKIELVSVSENK